MTSQEYDAKYNNLIRKKNENERNYEIAQICIQHELDDIENQFVANAKFKIGDIIKNDISKIIIERVYAHKPLNSNYQTCIGYEGILLPGEKGYIREGDKPIIATITENDDELELLIK